MIAIVGAGVVGLAIAAELSSNVRGVYIIEKNDSFGLETSSHNSEVLHAGIYYPENSLKAKTCVEGNGLLREICQRHGIGFRQNGKLIVAVNNNEVDQLELLLEQGKRNGARDLVMISKKKLDDMEPNVNAVAALYSPSSGSIDSHTLMRYLLNSAIENGAEIAYRSRVIGIEKSNHGYSLIIEDDSGVSTVEAEAVINSAGLHSDRVAKLAGIDIDGVGYRLHYCKGEYFSVGNGKNKLVTRLIYPVPEHDIGGLGTHVTLDVEGRMKLGPNARYVDTIDYKVDETQQETFYRSAKKFLPFINFEDLEPEMAGIRPKLQGPGEDFRDFVIRHEEGKNLPGFINLIGIESPGLTSAPSIAKYVARMLNGIL